MSTRFGQDFEVEIEAELKHELGQFFLLMFCRGYEVESETTGREW